MASEKQSDNRGSVGAKRSRNDAPRNEGDWTCLQCGNVNFSFRTVCNRSKCAAPRHSPSPRSLPGQFNHHPYAFGALGAPPTVAFGISGGYRVSLPFTGIRYEYGPSASAPGPYGFPSGYGLPGLLGGMGYSPGHGMNGFGYGFRGSPFPIANLLSGDSPDNGASRKRRVGPDGSAEGDWKCPSCGNINFSFRTSCNITKCAAPRPTPVPKGTAAGNKYSTNAPEGSWTCDKCGNLNYPFRTVCNRKGCGAEKPSEGDQ